MFGGRLETTCRVLLYAEWGHHPTGEASYSRAVAALALWWAPSSPRRMGGGIFIGNINGRATALMMVAMLVFAVAWEAFCTYLDRTVGPMLRACV